MAVAQPIVSSSSALSSTSTVTKRRRGSTLSTTSNSSSSSSSKYSSKGMMLPEDFVPLPYSVICGRGRSCAESVGNRRLLVICQLFIPKYARASKKEEKSVIVSDILQIVRGACPSPKHAFVKLDKASGRWFPVETLIAREKIGTVLRDCLHSKYKSSTKSKLAKRREQRAIKAAEEFYVLPTPTRSQSMPPMPVSSMPLLVGADEDSVLSGEELEMDSLFS